MEGLFMNSGFEWIGKEAVMASSPVIFFRDLGKQ
jgi:hypothetical protein